MKNNSATSSKFDDSISSDEEEVSVATSDVLSYRPRTLLPLITGPKLEGDWLHLNEDDDVPVRQVIYNIANNYNSFLKHSTNKNYSIIHEFGVNVKTLWFYPHLINYNPQTEQNCWGNTTFLEKFVLQKRIVDAIDNFNSEFYTLYFSEIGFTKKGIPIYN